MSNFASLYARVKIVNCRRSNNQSCCNECELIWTVGRIQHPQTSGCEKLELTLHFLA